ncbi:hypothetical protein [Pararhizobium sp. A13]|uniref:hypothetical protein n=1 Tax=Pararhizobium sp. A13 TaxID=3133975 RepID=UPI003249AF44
MIKQRRLERFLERRFGASVADRAAAAAVAHIILRLVRKHPWIAADLVIAGLGRAGKVGLREIARDLRAKMHERRATETKPLLLEAREQRSTDA